MKPFIADTHCHLEMPRFNRDRADVIRRAVEAGIGAMITVGADLNGSEKAVQLAGRYDAVYASVGVHPHDAKDFDSRSLQRLKELASKPKVVAIGETGLDYHYDHSPRQAQKEVFLAHLALAKEFGMPVIVHSRQAKEDTLSILEESGHRKGVLHCFSGDMDMAERAMAMGFCISIAGPVTFGNAGPLRKIAAAIPDDYLLVETDAPYLAPEPHRGKRNEPAYLVHTAELVAKLRGISVDDLARITTLNARRLFGIGAPVEMGRIAYAIRDSLYLNVTNRCTNACSFCIRYCSDYVKGHHLRLAEEPSAARLVAEIGDPLRYKEVVFCGYGEPLVRLDVVKEVASWVKSRGGKVRVNTNGHGNLINGRNILPELKGIVDAVSVSLDAQDAETYERLCKPVFENAFDAVLVFIKEALKHIPQVEATVVETEGVDVERCRRLAADLGVKDFRVRKLDVVG